MSKANINQQLANGKILPLLIKLAIPATAAQLVNALYSIVDRIYIGHLPEIGTIALSGVGLTFPITMLISAFSYLPGNGGAPLASIAIGEGKFAKAQKYLCNAVTMLLAIAAVMTVTCLIFMKPLLLMFGADSETLPYAYDYLQIYVLGTVFIELTLGLNAFINAQGFTTVGTLSVVIGAVLNIILDPVFMYVLDLGIRGAAIATVLSQMVSCVWVVRFLQSPKSNIRIQLKVLLPDWEIMRSTCALGVSPFTFRINESLVMIIMNRLILIYGGAAVHLHLAAMTMVNSIMQVFFMPLLGIVSGAQPILSFNFGARNYPRIRETIHYARLFSFSCATAMWLVFMFLPDAVCLLFTTSPELIAISKPAIRITFCTIFSLGFQMINQNAFVAMGNTRYSFLFGIMRKLLILIPVALILPHFFGIWGVYAAEAVANPVTAIITFIVFERYLSGIREMFSASK